MKQIDDHLWLVTFTPFAVFSGADGTRNETPPYAFVAASAKPALWATRRDELWIGLDWLN